jgi:hypothetical protein
MRTARRPLHRRDIFRSACLGSARPLSPTRKISLGQQARVRPGTGLSPMRRKNVLELLWESAIDDFAWRDQIQAKSFALPSMTWRIDWGGMLLIATPAPQFFSKTNPIERVKRVVFTHCFATCGVPCRARYHIVFLLSQRTMCAIYMPRTDLMLNIFRRASCDLLISFTAQAHHRCFRMWSKAYQ